MKVNRSVWTSDDGWQHGPAPLGDQSAADLVLVFAGGRLLSDPGRLEEIQALHPHAYVCGCSTAGEIAGARVLDDSITVTAVQFDSTVIRALDAQIPDIAASFEVGQSLASRLPKDDLVHAFVLSDGLNVNGTQLAMGLGSELPKHVAVTGGLSGDGANFSETYVCAGGKAGRNRAVLLGFYGKQLRVGYGSMGGWDCFGPERRVTRSKGNVLYELDGHSALGLYKEYLGEHAARLPASGLLFPLTIRQKKGDETLVRTILAVDEREQSMTFAGDIAEGSMARLMKANFDRLVDGAHGAAEASVRRLGDSSAQLAILISCVGRKLVLQQRVEEEVEAVCDVLGPQAATTGFYSYGEISPLTAEARCALHNQTMTITTLGEV